MPRPPTPKYRGGCAACGASHNHSRWHATFKAQHPTGYDIEEWRGTLVGNVTLPQNDPVFRHHTATCNRLCKTCYSALGRGEIPGDCPRYHRQPTNPPLNVVYGKRQRGPFPPPSPQPASPASQPSTPPSAAALGVLQQAIQQLSAQPSSATSPAARRQRRLSAPPAAATTQPQPPAATVAAAPLPAAAASQPAALAAPVVAAGGDPVQRALGEFLWWSKYVWVADREVRVFLAEPIARRLDRIIQQVQATVEMDRCSAFTDSETRNVTRVLADNTPNTIDAWRQALTLDRYVEAVHWTGDREAELCDHIKRFEVGEDGVVVYSHCPAMRSRLFDEKQPEDWHKEGHMHWLEAVRGRKRPTQLGTIGDHPVLTDPMGAELRRVERHRWQMTVGADMREELLRWEESGAGDEDVLAAIDDADLWPPTHRELRDVHCGRDIIVMVNQGPSGNGLHRDPVGGLASLVKGWKLWMWYDAADFAHLDDPSKLNRGIHLSRTAQVASFRWSLLGPGQTLFIHPDQPHLVITLSDTILLTQCRTFLPFRLLRSIGLILRGDVWDNAWVEGKDASNANTYPALIHLIWTCLQRRIEQWARGRDDRRPGLAVMAWEAWRERVTSSFKGPLSGVLGDLRPRRKKELSPKAQQEIVKDLQSLISAMRQLREKWVFSV